MKYLQLNVQINSLAKLTKMFDFDTNILFFLFFSRNKIIILANNYARSAKDSDALEFLRLRPLFCFAGEIAIQEEYVFLKTENQSY